jgi:hypothetical protein
MEPGGEGGACNLKDKERGERYAAFGLLMWVIAIFFKSFSCESCDAD